MKGLPGYDAWKTTPPEGNDPPEMGKRDRHKACGGEVRWRYEKGDWRMVCECEAFIEDEDAECYDLRDEGCRLCGQYTPDERYDEDGECCKACAKGKEEEMKR